MSIDAVTFGKKLRKLRRDRGWSQDRLGLEVGLHGRHIGKYEVGGAMPYAETLVKLADVFGVSVDYLLRDEEEGQSGAMRAPVPEQELLKKFEEVKKMPPEDQHIISALIDAYIKKQQIESILHH